MAFPNFFGGGGGQGPQHHPPNMADMVQQLIHAMGTSVQQTNENVAFLANTLHANARQGGGGGQGDNYGYRSLKPKKDVVIIQTASALATAYAQFHFGLSQHLS